MDSLLKHDHTLFGVSYFKKKRKFSFSWRITTFPGGHFFRKTDQMNCCCWPFTSTVQQPIYFFYVCCFSFFFFTVTWRGKKLSRKRNRKKQKEKFELDEKGKKNYLGISSIRWVFTRRNIFSKKKRRKIPIWNKNFFKCLEVQNE